MTSALPFLSAIGVSIAVFILTKLYSQSQWNRKYKLPPGPKGIPYFGNMFQMPPVHQGPWAKEMAEKYGEMFTLKIASNTWVFLNSSRVITALLEKRSAIYSSRPPMPYASTLMSGDCRMVIQPYGPQWRSIRKIMHAVLNIKNAYTFAPFQNLESKQLIFDLWKKPDNWYLATQRFANSTIMSVVFGKRILDRMDENVEALFATSSEFIAALQPGANLVDAFYILDSLPTWMKWWRKRGIEAHQRVIAVYQNEVDDLRRRFREGTCPPCFATSFLADPATSKLSHTQTLFALGSLIEAGSDTSRIILAQLLAAAAHDPRWVHRVQDELDSVCGSPLRLPEFWDRPNLPYLNAVVKEIFRWRPFAEIGVPHMLIQDDEFEGWKFPKGTIFTWNAWGLALSEDEYVDPERFWPERWLGKRVKGLEDPLSGHWSFGAGRRVCTGYHVGDTNVWIAAARILFCFSIDENPGNKIDTMDLNAAEHRFAPFEVNIRPRNDRMKELLEEVGRGL